MDRSIISLHEYRLRYPDSAEIPTLTQSGFVGLLLERQRCKATKLARRRARWRSMFAALRNLRTGIWRVLAIPELRRSAPHAEVIVQRQA